MEAQTLTEYVTEDDSDDNQDDTYPWEVSDEELLADLRAGAEVLGFPPTARDMQQFGEYAVKTYTKRFGSWNNALREAGFELPESRTKRSPLEGDDD